MVLPIAVGAQAILLVVVIIAGNARDCANGLDEIVSSLRLVEVLLVGSFTVERRVAVVGRLRRRRGSVLGVSHDDDATWPAEDAWTSEYASLGKGKRRKMEHARKGRK
jgi:hypothetical protein